MIKYYVKRRDGYLFIYLFFCGSNLRSLLVLGYFHNCNFFYYNILLRCILVVGVLF